MPDTSLSFLQRMQRAPNADAWRQLVDLYTPFVQSWLRRQDVPPADAADLTQETLAALVRDLPRFQHPGRPGAFRAWLRGIAANRLRGHRRKHKNQALNLDRLADQLEDPGSDLSRHWDREHDRHVVHRLLHRIQGDFAAETWRVFLRVVIEGAAATAVAAEFQLNITAVWNAQSRVLRRLRQEADGLLE